MATSVTAALSLQQQLTFAALQPYNAHQQRMSSQSLFGCSRKREYVRHMRPLCIPGALCVSPKSGNEELVTFCHKGGPTRMNLSLCSSAIQVLVRVRVDVAQVSMLHR
jgi:hypothetical protein